MMQNSANDLEDKKDQEIQPECNSDEDVEMIRKRREQMRSPLHITRKLHTTAEMFKIVKKRREKFGKIVYEEKNSPHFYEERIMSMMRDIIQITSLTSISLTFRGGYRNNSYCIEDVELESFSGCLRYLPSLKSVSLDFFNSNITGEGLKFIGDCLKNLTVLTSATFNFSYCLYIDDIGLKPFSDCLRHLTALTKISLDFSDNSWITDTELEYLSRGLGNLHSLQSCTLIFTSCSQICGGGLGLVCESLRHLPALTSISITCWDCQTIYDGGMKAISNGLRHLLTLNNISLDFSGNDNLNDEGIVSICDSLRHLHSLTRINLKFMQQCITDVGLRSISDCFKSLNSLTSISLNFSECFMITDEGLRSVCDCLKHFPELINLSLSFSYYPKITNEGLRSLSDCLRHFLKIERIRIEIDNSVITEGEVRYFVNCLRCLCSLTSISLYLRHIKISNATIEEIDEYLRKKKVT